MEKKLFCFGQKLKPGRRMEKNFGNFGLDLSQDRRRLRRRRQHRRRRRRQHRRRRRFQDFKTESIPR